MNHPIKKKFLFTLVLLSLNLKAEILSNFSLSSDYLLRGKTQTEHKMAVQGGLDWDQQLDPQSGINLGTWFSNAKESVEQDLYFNYKKRFNIYGQGIFFNYLFYHYPVLKTNIGTHSLAFGLFSLWFDLEINYIPKYFGVKSSSTYIVSRFHYEFFGESTLLAEVGKNIHQYNNLVGETDYWNYSVGIGKEYEEIYFQINFSDTNRKLFLNSQNQKTNDQSFSLTLSKFFY